MLKTIRQLFENTILPGAGSENEEERERAVGLATAGLLVEMTRADFEVHPEERQATLRALREVLHLDAKEAKKLLRLGEKESDQSVSLFEFTNLIHQHFRPERKLEIVEHLWRIAYTDGRLDHHEQHLMSKVRRLLHIPQKDFVAAKQRGREKAEP